MTTKTLLLLAWLVFGSTVTVLAQWGVTGQGELVTQELDIDEFDGVRLALSGRVYLTQGSPQKVEVKAQQNIIDLLDTDVKNGTWRIKTSKNIRKHKGVAIYITMETLREAGISGSGDIETTAPFTDLGDLQTYVSGSGNLKLEVESRDVEGAISGSGEIALSGAATNLDFSVSGSGDIDASRLEANRAKVRISGSGDVHVHCQENLEVAISGSGDLTYRGGNPSVKARVSGSGDVEKVN